MWNLKMKLTVFTFLLLDVHKAAKSLDSACLCLNRLSELLPGSLQVHSANNNHGHTLSVPPLLPTTPKHHHRTPSLSLWRSEVQFHAPSLHEGIFFQL